MINKTYIRLTIFWSSILISVISLYGCMEDQSSKVLKEIDIALENVDQLQKEAISKAESISLMAKYETDAHNKIQALLRVAIAYQNLDLEKSLEYTKAAYKIALQNNNRIDSVSALLELASLYNTEGLMVKEATDIFLGLPYEILPDSLRLNYFILGVQINKSLANRAFDKDLKNYYDICASILRDSVLKLDPKSDIIASNKLTEQGKTREALQLMLQTKPNNRENQRIGPYYHYISGLYRQLEMSDSQKVYLAKAALDDLKHGIREYMALTELADMLQTNDINRAYKYIGQSQRDALLSHSSLRQREVAPIFNTINIAYQEKQKQLINTVLISSISLLIVLISLFIFLILLRKKNKQLYNQSILLKDSRDKLDMANMALERNNQLLDKEGKIKSKYINSFMELCLSYLAKMESFRAKLGKIAGSGDLKKVINAINSNRYVNEEISEFYKSFDSAFFSLYPEFIEKLNSLLKEDKKYESLGQLTTELRIYALIWLGIDASGEIARFLRCSESTVYNYRTQMRNRALKRDTFEKDFSLLSSKK